MHPFSRREKSVAVSELLWYWWYMHSGEEVDRGTPLPLQAFVAENVKRIDAWHGSSLISHPETARDRECYSVRDADREAQLRFNTLKTMWISTFRVQISLKLMQIVNSFDVANRTEQADNDIE